MSNVFNLADVRSELDEEYKSFTIDLGDARVVLRHPLRVPSEQRDEVLRLIDTVSREVPEGEQRSGEQIGEAVAAIADLVAKVADNPEAGRQLSEALAGDTPLALKLFQAWMGVINATTESD